MTVHTLHIGLYDFLFLGTIFTGLIFALLLFSAKSLNKAANRFLSLAILGIVLWALNIIGWLPVSFSLAIGPLLYLHVSKLTQPRNRFSWRHALHFAPALAELCVYPAATTFPWQLVTFISIIFYAGRSRSLIKSYYQQLKFNDGDRYRYELNWLHRLLTHFIVLCMLCVLYETIGRFYHFGTQASYPVDLCIAMMIIRIGIVTFLRSEAAPLVEMSPASKPYVGSELKQKGVWLKKLVETKQFYENPDLSLSSLAEQLDINPHELSRIVNVVLKKSFADFINEYRIREVVRKMQDPAYDQLTLLGIAYDSGFNSKTNFNRTFRQLTGKSPAAYKNQLKKERPFYNPAPYLRNRALILHYESQPVWRHKKLNRMYMFKNYLKIAWRNLVKNKSASFINVGGLAVGMAVAMLIGLWIFDELSFDKYHQNYNRIAQVMQNKTYNGTVTTSTATSLPVEEELRKTYGSDLKHTGVTFWTQNHVLTAGDKKLEFPGTYATTEIPEMFTLKMLKGSRDALKDPSSLIISQLVAKALFGSADPMGKMIRFDDQASLVVAGVYEDLPFNTTIHDMNFLVSWGYFTASQEWLNRAAVVWGEDSFPVYVQVADHVDIDAFSKKIKDIKLKNGEPAEVKLKPQIFLQPMSKWHLYSKFRNGVNAGGAIEYVWLFGIIGVFVLLLACINFMNLSTARSEKRAKEVGIRKAVGSLTGQLIGQFFFESLLITILAFGFSLILVWLALPFFNDIAYKQMHILWDKPLFWVMATGFTLFTGIIAGSYPALYLSSFRPVKVLKGTFKTGPAAAIPRKVLVVIQFTVSVILMVGTIVVFNQVQFAKNRPVGYTRAGLIQTGTAHHLLEDHFNALREDLIRSGAVTEATESSSTTTEIHNNKSDVNWTGKDPSLAVDFAVIRVTTQYGKTLGWQFKYGRDFSTRFLTDSSGVVLNEAAVKYMNLKDPVGKTVNFGGTAYHIIGVIKDMVMGSPYEPAKQTIFYIGAEQFDAVIIKVNPAINMHDALIKIEAIYKTYAPSVPFSYQFVDDEYAKKFTNEERIGKLASSFAALAIFISCLGLFGMATFMAEQRIKEIGVRKVLGASVFNLWRLMSMDFVVLVMVAVVIAAPIAWLSMHQWLKNFTYRTSLSWWIFAETAVGAVIIALLTVSYQSIKAGLANPAKSLRSE